LIVLSGENTALSSEYRDVWMELQADLARLSVRGKLVALPREQLRPDLPGADAIAEVTRQVVGDIRLGRLR
jgi:hypothetical protein